MIRKDSAGQNGRTRLRLGITRTARPFFLFRLGQIRPMPPTPPKPARGQGHKRKKQRLRQELAQQAPAKGDAIRVHQQGQVSKAHGPLPRTKGVTEGRRLNYLSRLGSRANPRQRAYRLQHRQRTPFY